MSNHYQRWDSSQEAQLRILFSQKKSDEQIAEIMGRTKSAVETRRIKLGLLYHTAIDIAVKKSHKWTEDEIQFIRLYWLSKKNKWMTRKLGVSVTQYKYIRKRLGLLKENRQHLDDRRYTPLEKYYIEIAYGVIQATRIAKTLHRKPRAILTYAQRHGLKSPYCRNRKVFADTTSSIMSQQMAEICETEKKIIEIYHS